MSKNGQIIDSDSNSKYAKVSSNILLCNYAASEVDTVQEIVYKLVDKIFNIETGKYEGSESICSTPTEHRIEKDEENSVKVDQRLKYWQNYINEREDLKQKIKEKTHKTDSELLLNQNHKFGQEQLLKRIMDYAERLNPLVLAEKKLENLKDLPCRTTVFETLPKSEQKGEYLLGITDLPSISRQEHNIPDCNRKNGILNSICLSDSIAKKEEDIQNILDFYPDIDLLQVIGEKKKFSKRHLENWKCFESQNQNIEKTPTKKHSEFDIRIIDADSFREEEKTPEYFVAVNNECLDLKKERQGVLVFDIAFSGRPWKKIKKKLIKIHNLGLKTIDIDWIAPNKSIDKNSTLFKNCETTPPAFYFDKNPFRLVTGEISEMDVLFCCGQPGIHTESWCLQTDPKFFSKDFKIIVNLFGVCQPYEKYDLEFQSIKADLVLKANQAMVKSIIDYTSHLVKDIEPIPVFDLSEETIFSLAQPNLLAHQGYMDEMKTLHNNIQEEIRGENTKWNYDMKSLRILINYVEDSEKRTMFHKKFVDILQNMKQLRNTESFNFDEQKLALVSNAVATALENMDIAAVDLKEIMFETDLKLEYDEVLILDKGRKPSDLQFTLGVENDNEAIESFSFVKSKLIKEQNKKIFEDMLLVKFAGYLKEMSEEVAGIIEEINKSKGFFTNH